MAKDLNTPNLSIVAENDSLKIVSIDGEARLGAVYLDGERLEGVYSEVRSGQLDAVSADSAEMAEVPSGLKARDAFLKKWSLAAQSSKKAKKAGGASMLLLTLAACGGDGGDSVVVTGEVSAPNDIIQISSAVVGAVVTVVSNLTRGELFNNIEIDAEGEGTLTLSFEDAADVVMLSENTDISGFDTIVVERGTVDFTAVDLPSSVTILQVGSSATLSRANYEQLNSVELRAGATEGSITVVADTFADVLSIDAHDITAAEVSVSVVTNSELTLTLGQVEDLVAISVEFVGEYSVVDTADALLAVDAATLTEANSVEVLGGDAGTLSVENVAALRAVTTNDTWSFDVEDAVENVFNGDSIIESARETLLSADSVSISGELNQAQVTALEALNSNVEVAPFVTSIEISDTALSIGDTTTVTITFSEAVTGLEISDFTADNASLSNLLSATDNLDGTQSYTLTLTPDASIEDTTNVVTLAPGAVLDAASNANAGSATTGNYTVDTSAPSAPSFALANDTGTDGDDISSDGTVNVSGIEAGATWEYSVDVGASWTAGLGTTFALSEGSYAIGDIQVRQYDAAGNVSAVQQNSGAVTIDTTNPTVTSIEISDTALSIGEAATVTITFSEAVTGLEIADFDAANASLSNLSPATDNLDGTQSYTLTLTPDASIEDTTNVVTLAPGAVLDAASNANAGTATTDNYTVDTSAPSAPSFALANDTGTDGDDISNNGTVNVSGLEAGATWEYLVDGGASWTAGSGTAFTLSEGSYAIGDIQVRQYDAAGNVGVVHQNSGVVTIDTTSPTVVSVVLADNSFFLDGNTQTTVASEQTTVTITFAEAVAVVDLTVEDFTVDHGTLSNLAAVNVSNGYASEFTVTLTAEDLSSPDASNTIQLQANTTADKAGNASEASTVVNFSIDKDVSATWADFVGTDTLNIDGVEDASQPSTLTISDVPDAARIENDEARLFNTTDNGEQNSIRGVESIVFEVVEGGSVDFDLGANAEDAGIDSVSITGQYDASVLNLGGRNSGGEALTGSGNDQITGSNYSDVIESGSGKDVLDGGQGGDTFKFATADLDSADVVDGGDGDDTIVITNDANLEDGDFTNVTSVKTLTLSSTGSNSVVLGAEVNQAGIRLIDATASTQGSNIDIDGIAANMVVEGGSGDDTITGGSAADRLSGYDGDDEFIVTDTDKVDGGDGNDTVYYNASVSVKNGGLTDSELVNVENVEITNTGDAAYDFSAQTESLTISGNSGDDTITGGSAADSISGGNGDDVFIVTDTDQTVDGGFGNDTVRYDASVSATNLQDADLVNVEKVEITNTDDAAYDFSAQSEALAISGNSGDDTITGGSAADAISGGDGDDVFIATDTDQTVDGGNDIDTVRYNASVSATNLQDADLVNVENVEITNTDDAAYDFSAQSEALTISGNSGDDTITGGSAADSISGGDGDDVFTATDTDQTVDGGNDNDTVRYDASVSATNLQDADLVNVENVEITNTDDAAYDFSAQSEALTISGNSGDDTITGGSAADVIDGGEGSDVFLGVDNNDFIDGGSDTGADDTDVVRLSADYAPLSDANMVRVEEVVVATSADTFVDLANQTEDLVIMGNTGDDTLVGGEGDDTITGADGADEIVLTAGGDDLIVYRNEQESGFEIQEDVVVGDSVDTLVDFDATGVWEDGADYNSGGTYANADIIDMEYRSDDMQVTQVAQVVRAANESDALKDLSDMLGGQLSSTMRENYTDAVVVRVEANDEANSDADFDGYYMVINSDLNSGFDSSNDMVLRFVWTTENGVEDNLADLDENIFFWSPDSEPDAWVSPNIGVTVFSHDGSMSQPINGVTNVDALGRAQIFGNTAGADVIDATNEDVNDVEFNFSTGKLSGASDDGANNANTITYVNFDGFKAGGAGSTVTLSSGAENIWGGDGNDKIVINSQELSGEFSNTNGAIEELVANGQGNDLVGLNSGSITRVEQLTMIADGGGQSSVRMTETQLDDLNTSIVAQGSQDKIIVATGDLETLVIDDVIEHLVIEDDSIGNAVSVVISARSADVTVESVSSDDVITVDASGLANSATLKLIGVAGAKFIVTNLAGDLDASELGSLVFGPIGFVDGDTFDSHDVANIEYGLIVTTVDNTDDNALTITTGLVNTHINTPHFSSMPSTDTVTVEAGAMLDDAILKLDGYADVVVNNVGQSIDILAGGNTLNGSLTVNVVDDENAADTIEVQTGTNDTTVNANDGDDSVTINAISMVDGTLLTLTGAADQEANDVIADVDSSATGDVIVNLNDDGADTVQYDTTVSISGAANNGVINTGNFTTDGTVVLGGTSEINVNVEDSTNIVLGSQGSNINVETSEIATINAKHLLDSSDQNSTGKITLTGNGDAEINSVESNIVIIGNTNDDIFEGDITIRSADGTTGSSAYNSQILDTEDAIEVRTGAGNLSLEMAGEGDFAHVYAELMSSQSDLSIEGAGRATVRDFGGNNISIKQGASEYNYVDIYLDDDDGNQTVIIDNLSGALNGEIHTGSYDETDTIRLTGGGKTDLDIDGFGIQVIAASNADLNMRLGDTTTTGLSQGSVFVDASLMSENSYNNISIHDNYSEYDSGDVTINHVSDSLTVDASHKGDLVVNAINDSSYGSDGHISYDTIIVNTGSGNTTLMGLDVNDYFEVDASLISDGKVLTLSGSTEVDVDNANGTFTIDGSDEGLGDLTGELYVDISDNSASDTLTVITGQSYTEIHSDDTADSIIVEAGALKGDLDLSGSSDVTVNNLPSNYDSTIDGSGLTDTLTVNATGESDERDAEVSASQANTTINTSNSSGSDYFDIDAKAMADGTILTLSGAAEMDVDNANGSISIIANGGEDGDPMTGILTIVADDGEDSDVLYVKTGTNHTHITANDADDIVIIDAEAMADGKTLELSGAADMDVDNANADLAIQASELNGELNITVDDDGVAGPSDTLEVYTGSNDTTIDASDEDDSLVVNAEQMADSKQLNLSGVADVLVVDVASSIKINADALLEGNLGVIVGDNGETDLVEVDTGSNNTVIDTADDDDRVDINAIAMDDFTTLTLIGAAEMDVDNANGSITIEGNDPDGALNGTLNIVAYNDDIDDVGDTLIVNTGTNDTHITALDADDTVDIDAEAMADGTILMLSGAAEMDVDNANGSISIIAGNFFSEFGEDLTGTLNIVADDDGGEDGDTLTVVTGWNDTTVNAADADDLVEINAVEMVDDTILMLSGAAQMNVDYANGSITIEGNDDTLGALTGELYIVADGEDGQNLQLGDEDNAQGPILFNEPIPVLGEDGDTLIVNTGTNNTYIMALDGEDTVEIDAAAMADDTTLTLNGFADMDVDNANGSIAIMADGLDGEDALFGTLTIVADDDGEGGVGDTLVVNTGTNDTHITALDADDVVNIDTAAMDDDRNLLLFGAANVDIDNANGAIHILADGQDGDILTGTLNIVADDDGVAGPSDTLEVYTGSNDTTIDAADADNVVEIDAAAMADDTTLTLSGAAKMIVDNANGPITIEGNSETDSPLEGQLFVYSDDDDGVGDTLVVNTGTNSTYIEAADADDIVDIDAEVMADGTTLQLSGAANMDVDHVNASMVIDADGEDILTGTLNIVADDDAGGEVLTVFTGLNDTTIDAADEDDIVDIFASKMADGTTLTLSGAAEMTVDNTNGSITIEGNDDTLGALTGELYIVADDGGGEDGDLLVVNTGTNNTYIDTADGEDIVEIDVQAMADDKALRLSGEADMDVDNANGSISIMADGVDGEDGPLFGTLTIVADDDGEGGEGDTLVVNTGTNTTYIAALDADDVVNIDTDAMSDGGELHLLGAADVNIDNANGSIFIIADGGKVGDPLTGTLTIVADDDDGEDGDILVVYTGTNDTTIDAADAEDVGYVYADDLADDELLTLRGAADFIVYDLAGDINAGGQDADPSIPALSGSLYVEMADGADSAIVGGSSQLDSVTSSDEGDTLRLTAIETVYGGAGDDQITITDDNLETIKMYAGNDTLTFEDGSALTASVSLSGGDNTADGQDVVNVNVDTELNFLLTSEFSGIEKLNLVDDESQDGLDATITLDGGFDNDGAITFDASTFNAGEVLTFDASSVVSGNEILVIGGEGDDVITTARQDVDRGLMTLDLTSGGQDTVVINNDGWNGEGLILTTAGADMSIENGDDWSTLAPPLNALEHGVEINGFTGGAGGDRLDIVFSSGVSSNGSIEEGYVLGTGDPIDKSTGTVIELTSVDYTINLDNASITLQDIASDLSAGGDGDALVDLSDGNYSVVIYSSQVASGDDMADAYLFNIRVDGGDGLDFEISNDPQSPNGQEDNDMIEYVGVIREVGADILVGENFI